MMKRLALLCCILLLPTIAAAASVEGTTNYGDFWLGGQVGGIFTPDRSVDVNTPFFAGRINKVGTDPGVMAGMIVGYNFCMSYRPSWQRYFGVALDFSWNQFNHGLGNAPNVDGNQFALSFLGRLQYPLMGSERFTRGRIVPFLMFGPAIVWSNADFSNYGGGNRTRTNVGVVAEVGMEFFICPSLSIGPSFRYRHVFGESFELHRFNVDVQGEGLNQFAFLGRLAYHF